MHSASRQTADDRLARYMEEGQDLIERAGLVGDVSDYDSWKAARKRWIDSTAEALDHIYGGSREAGEFRSAASAPAAHGRWQAEYAGDVNSIRAAKEFLSSLRERLEVAQSEADQSEVSEERSADWAFAEEIAHSGHEQELSAPKPADSQEPELSAATDSDPAPAMSSDSGAAPAGPSDSDAARAMSSDSDAAPANSSDSRPLPARFADPDIATAGRVGSELVPPSLGPGARHRPTGEEDVDQQPADASVPAIRVATPALPQPELTGRVFLVHGRNARWKEVVVALLERAGSHEITILNERTSGRGSRVGEFVEQGTGQGYAVILLTADEIGAPRLDSDKEPFFTSRACQGVVFEMGFLAGALTPRCVCVLYEDGVELPCDLGGMVYVRLDPAGTWQSKLLLQLRGAGFAYDLNGLAPGSNGAPALR